jgi:DUF917 family protein
MRELDAQAIEDIATGSAVLATGGGGDPYIGKIAALAAIGRYGRPKLLTVDELDAESMVVTAFFMGSPMTALEKLPLGVEFDAAWECMQDAMNGRLTAIMPVEIGGLESMVPLVVAAKRGLPIVDSDLMGRAFPEIQLVTATLFGIKANPFVLADERSNTVLFDVIDNVWAERLGRVITSEMGAVAAGLTYAMTPAQLKQCGVLGSLSYAETIGRSAREARERKEDPVQAVLKVTSGRLIFAGKVVDVQRRIERAWTRGEASIDGTGDYAGSNMAVHFQNENLVAIRDGDIVATVPDLITIMDAESGLAMTTEDVRYGFRVVVLGMPCADIWRSEAGVALAGPRHFGYQIDYRPLEITFSAGATG